MAMFVRGPAEAHRTAGRMAEAIALHERNLAAREQVLGPHHPDTLSSASNLAAAFRADGRAAEAIALHGKTVAAREQVLGRDHPDTMDSRNELAVAYLAEGRTDKAIPLFEKTVAARERVLGRDGTLNSPRTIWDRFGAVQTLNNLGTAYWGLRRLEEAVGCYERALAILAWWSRAVQQESTATRPHKPESPGTPRNKRPACDLGRPGETWR